MIPLILLLLLQVPASTEPKLAQLEGTVTHAGTKQPIRKAKVTLTPVTSAEASYTAETDDAGKYALKDFKAGRYRLAAEKQGYQKSALGWRGRDFESGQTLRVDAGADVRNLDIAMPRYGVIAGKIIDADGEPVAQVIVFALRTVHQAGRRYQIPAGTVPTLSDDQGVYRVSQLPPDKYVVCAIPLSVLQPGTVAAESKPLSADAPVYTCYPNTGQASEGAPFEVKDGSEIPSVDIRLIKARTVNVRGVIRGLPANAGTVSLLVLSPKGAGPTSTLSSPRSMLQGGEGKFEFKGVAPGLYVLHSVPVGGSQTWVVKYPLEVGDQPVTGLEVPVIVPFDVKAQLTAAGSGDPKFGAVKVILSPADGVISSVSMGTVTEKCELTSPNVIPGRHTLNVSGLAPGYYVQSVTLGEQTIEGKDLDILTPAAGPLTIALAKTEGGVAGAVRNDKGEPLPGVWVVLAPSPMNSFKQRFTKTDQNGMYHAQYTPPGDYLVFAVDGFEPGRLEDEEYLKEFAPKAKKVTVSESGRVSQDLTLISR